MLHGYKFLVFDIASKQEPYRMIHDSPSSTSKDTFIFDFEDYCEEREEMIARSSIYRLEDVRIDAVR